MTSCTKAFFPATAPCRWILRCRRRKNCPTRIGASFCCWHTPTRRKRSKKTPSIKYRPKRRCFCVGPPSTEHLPRQLPPRNRREAVRPLSGERNHYRNRCSQGAAGGLFRRSARGLSQEQRRVDLRHSPLDRERR